MPTLKKILLLDDDGYHLSQLREVLQHAGHQVFAAHTPEIARTYLEQNPDFAIVDLFLDGNLGSELSNDFIRDFLVPRNIPYGRMTSAPELVPKEYAGSWVLHKRRFRDNPGSLLVLLEREG